MELWTAPTKTRITDHCKDFNVDNYTKRMAAAGGFESYIRSLGGIFAAFLPLMGQVCKTLSRYRQGVQFVMGVMTIWGPDYNNESVYYRWGGGSADAFRKTGKGKCRGGALKTILDDPAVVTTNCNYGCDTLLRALGLYKTGTAKCDVWATQYGVPVIRKADLQPGDLVHFFTKPIDRMEPETWKAGNWKHVAIVYAVEGGKIWLADFGSRFVKTKEPLHYMPVNDSPAAGGEYGASYWSAVHAFDLEDDTVREKTTADLAVELWRLIDAFLEAKKTEYGEEVYTMSEDYLIDQDAYLRAAADYVLNGYAGSGEARKVFFGNDYEEVQAKVNWVIQTAQDVLDGKYGSGDARKEALGDDYYIVQAQVNRMVM